MKQHEFYVTKKCWNKVLCGAITSVSMVVLRPGLHNHL